MPIDILVPFIVTATVLTMVPGLDTAMVLRAATIQGARYGVATAFGVALGCLCWGTAAAFGLAALLHAWPLAFLALRWTGALYLAWLGAQLVMRPRKALVLEAGGDPGDGLWTAARRGFTTNILNPKVGLFYLTLLPQFVPHQARGGGMAFLLATLQVAIALVWFSTLSALAHGIRSWLRRPGVVVALDRVTGGIFVLLGYELTQFTGLHA
ncbi:LysE family translocator [Sphingomonas sp. PAMC 26605]|uniref:LysE family translocator n=1 Tax=Sphingomonas sp. PAMC 26605 TaxID=1112214 RepID=UPI0005617E8A|nr:LysE family translocator [Sphingomonas sp. PAMC 26605]